MKTFWLIDCNVKHQSRTRNMGMFKHSRNQLYTHPPTPQTGQLPAKLNLLNTFLTNQIQPNNNTTIFITIRLPLHTLHPQLLLQGKNNPGRYRLTFKLESEDISCRYGIHPGAAIVVSEQNIVSHNRSIPMGEVWETPSDQNGRL